MRAGSWSGEEGRGKREDGPTCFVVSRSVVSEKLKQASNRNRNRDREDMKCITTTQPTASKAVNEPKNTLG